MSTETAAWPIRVGGVYLHEKSDLCAARVTAIDGETIHYVYHQPDGRPYDHAGNNKEIDAKFFRVIWTPEDQSPIPALVAALTAVQWGNGRCVACQRTQEEGHYEGCAVAEALQKAGA